MVRPKWYGKKSEVRMPLTILDENMHILKGYLKFFISEKMLIFKELRKSSMDFIFFSAEKH